MEVIILWHTRKTSISRSLYILEAQSHLKKGFSHFLALHNFEQITSECSTLCGDSHQSFWGDRPKCGRIPGLVQPILSRHENLLAIGRICMHVVCVGLCYGLKNFAHLKQRLYIFEIHCKKLKFYQPKAVVLFRALPIVPFKELHNLAPHAWRVGWRRCITLAVGGQIGLNHSKINFKIAERQINIITLTQSYHLVGQSLCATLPPASRAPLSRS